MLKLILLRSRTHLMNNKLPPAEILYGEWHVLKNKPLPSHCPGKNSLHFSRTLSAWANCSIASDVRCHDTDMMSRYWLALWWELQFSAVVRCLKTNYIITRQICSLVMLWFSRKYHSSYVILRTSFPTFANFVFTSIIELSCIVLFWFYFMSLVLHIKISNTNPMPIYWEICMYCSHKFRCILTTNPDRLVSIMIKHDIFNFNKKWMSCSKRELFHMQFPLLCHVASLYDGNCHLTMPVI